MERIGKCHIDIDIAEKSWMTFYVIELRNAKPKFWFPELVLG